MILYRPVGYDELKLVYQLGMRKFPPRLPEQPIFYPVLNREYACQIAEKWNTQPSHPKQIGFVLEFEVDDQYVAKFSKQVVGGKMHEELWVSAEELEEFNTHIVDQIKVTDVFLGEDVELDLDEKTNLPGSWLKALDGHPYLEQLAALEHEQWAAWTKHFLENLTPENRKRWEKQVAETFSELSQEEKEKDREWARKVIEVFSGEKKDVLYKGRFIELARDGKWEFARRTKASGIVAVVATTPKDELIIVEQYRPPVGKRVIEIPAGLAGDVEGEEDEALLTAAQRELLEETGYEAEEWQYLSKGPSSAGLCTEVISFFKASGLRKVTEGGGDESEDIEIHQIPLADIETWLREREKTGSLVDYKVYAALYWSRHTG